MRRQRGLSLFLGLGATLALVTLVFLFVLSRSGIEPDHFTGVSRIVAVGDVHGGYDEFVGILRAAGLVNAQTHWSGGRTHLVQTGDLLDRGAHSREVMDLVMRLEGEARAAGGRVHALLGNHEVMNLTGDLRYVSAGEYAAFVTAGSTGVRDRAFARLADPARRDDPAYRARWDEAHPLGWVEHREAFTAGGRYGRWIRSHHAVLKIDRYLFLHGGIGPSLATSSVSELNERVREEVRMAEPPNDGLTVGRSGLLWYRGLAQADEDGLRPHVERLLETHGVDHIVIGHTTTPGAVLPRLGGAVLMIDVGLSLHYGARAACLVVEDSEAFALHRGRALRLPVNGTDGLVFYLRAAAELDPIPSPLGPLIDAGGRFPLADEASSRP